jgi:hypothetical protein
MAEQYSIFGTLDKIPEAVRKKPTHKYQTMQELNGFKKNETCGTCKHCLKCDYHDRTYYKCEAWIISHGAGTDIRLKNKACGKWEAGE